MAVSWMNMFAIVASSYFGYTFIKRRIEWYRFKEFAKANGCGEMALAKSALPW